MSLESQICNTGEVRSLKGQKCRTTCTKIWCSRITKRRRKKLEKTEIKTVNIWINESIELWHTLSPSIEKWVNQSKKSLRCSNDEQCDECWVILG